MKENDISAAELKQRLAESSGLNLIDVREELEYHTFNIGGENIPLGKLAAVIEDLDYDKSDEIIVICQRGLRSKTGVELLNAAGYVNARNLAGGLLAYRK